MKKILKDGLIPHVENDFRPTMLQRGAMAGMSLLIFFSFLLANTQALMWLDSDWLVGTILPAVVVDLTNNERAAVAARPLVRSAVLDRAANLKAADMAAGEYFSHDSPKGITPWHWFREVGYVYAHAGENLAVYFSDSDEVVEAWMDSPTHRANIVNNTYQEIGIGTAKGKYQGYNTVFVVQLFGTPAVLPVVREPESQPLAIVETTTIVTEDLATTSAVVVLGAEDGTEEAPVTTGIAEANENQDEIKINEELVLVLDSETTVTEGNPITETEVIPEVNEKQNLVKATSFYSTAATSSGLTPVAYSNLSRIESGEASFSAKLATRPNKVLQYLYLIIGSLTMFALWYSIILGVKHRRLAEVGYGSFLLLLMVALFYVHNLVTGGVMIN